MMPHISLLPNNTYKKIKLYLLALALCVATSTIAFAAPSFDCTKSLTPTEQLICSDNALSDLDRQLASAFALKQNEPQADITTLIDTQRNWLKARAIVCGIPSIWHASNAKANPARCLMMLYRERIESLNRIPRTTTNQTATTIKRTDLTETHLNIYDLADACKFFNMPPMLKMLGGLQTFYSAIPQDNRMTPIFITQRYYATVDETQHFKGCELNIYFYSLDKEGRLNGQKITANKMAALRTQIDKYPLPSPPNTEHYVDDRSHIDEDFSGCPLEINWISVEHKQFTILSIVDTDSSNALTSADYPRDYLDCSAWRALNFSRDYIYSGETDHVRQNDDQRTVIQASEFPMGALISRDDDLKCFRSHDVFEFHIIVEKQLFDKEMREPLMDIAHKAHLDLLHPGEGFKYGTLSSKTVLAQSEWLRNYVKKKGCLK